jgi:hypothetical protein
MNVERMAGIESPEEKRGGGVQMPISAARAAGGLGELFLPETEPGRYE